MAKRMYIVTFKKRVSDLEDAHFNDVFERFESAELFQIVQTPKRNVSKVFFQIEQKDYADTLAREEKARKAAEKRAAAEKARKEKQRLEALARKHAAEAKALGAQAAA